MKENTTVAKITITKGNANRLISSVKKSLELVNKGYLAITPDVAKLYDTKAYEVLGYKNFDEMCVNEFGMSHGTTVGIRKVFALYGSKSSKDGSYTIPEKYTKFGYTKLLLFAQDEKKFKDAGIDPIEEFSPKMTIGEMKSHLKMLLEDKAKEQDENAIDTEATEAQGEATEATEATETTVNDLIEMSPQKLIAEIIDLVEHLKTKVEVKPEKMVLLDAVVANLKEIKELIK